MNVSVEFLATGVGGSCTVGVLRKYENQEVGADVDAVVSVDDCAVRVFELVSASSFGCIAGCVSLPMDSVASFSVSEFNGRTDVRFRY